MTLPISRAAAQERDSARQANGRFGEQHLSEVSLDLAEMGSSAADELMGQVEAIRREAFEAGQARAYEKAADLIHDFAGPSESLSGYVLKDPNGKFQVEVPEVVGYDMVDHVLKATSDSLRAYASGGFKEESAAYVGAGAQTEPAVAPAAGDKFECSDCNGTGFGYSVGPNLASGNCEACNGHGTQTEPGDDAVECTYCRGSAMVDSTTECPVCRMGKMAGSRPGQDEVFVPGHGTFYRTGDLDDGRKLHPDTPSAMRLEANRPLTDDEMQRAAQLLGYSYATTVRGENMDEPHRDSDRSFVVAADTTKSRSDDLGEAMWHFENNLPDMMRNGSPVRTTDRAGAGTKGTRLVEGLADPELTFTIYYDDVI